jgi:hypothetical protein
MRCYNCGGIKETFCGGGSIKMLPGDPLYAEDFFEWCPKLECMKNFFEHCRLSSIELFALAMYEQMKLELKNEQRKNKLPKL